MKRNIIPLLCLLLLSCSDNNDDSVMNTLPTDSFENSGNLYFESGICVCPNAVVGDQDKIEGTIILRWITIQSKRNWIGETLIYAPHW
jgi:hypothetical protein